MSVLLFNAQFGRETLSKYCISGITVKIIAPEWVLHDNLRIFLCDTGDTDIDCSVIFKKRTVISPEKAKIIVKTKGTSIFISEECIHILNNNEKDIPSYMVVSEDWSICTMFIDPEYDAPDDNEMVQCVRNGVFDVLRKAMIAVLVQKHGLMIHSSTILWNDKGVMFSAPSGTGKSTHTNLWKQLYGVKVLDGDATACRIVNGIPFVYGLPWCGTSDEFMNHRAPLGAIIFLQQAGKNKIERLDFKEAFMRLTARSFLLPFNDKMMNQFLNVIQEVAACADCYLLNCLPDIDAVELVKRCLEKN